MLRSFLPLLVAGFALMVVGCSTETAHPEKPPLPTATVRTATMNVTPGVEVLARVALPDGFIPSPAYPPMWLQAGKEVAVAGARNGRTVIMGYGGAGYRTPRVIAEDGGIGAKDGKLVDLAVSPDGMVIALAVASTKQKHLDVVTREVISPGAANPVSSFEGEFESASLGWVGDFTIPVELRARPAGSASGEASAAALASHPALAATPSGLYIVSISGVVTTGYLKLNCKMSRLSWSPQGIVAVGAGDTVAPPVVIDRAKETCQPIIAKAPIRVIDWAHDSKSFLFQNADQKLEPGTYRYDLTTNAARLVAISSGAAAFVGNDQILALGSRALTISTAKGEPQRPVRAQVAISNQSGSEIEVESLGFNTTPAMLADSAMTYTRATDAAAIATFSPTPEGPVRKIVIYSVAPKRAFLIAFGPARGLVSMSWSPHGRYLALADGDGTAAALTVLAPPR
jgi:hypothetical protein